VNNTEVRPVLHHFPEVCVGFKAGFREVAGKSVTGLQQIICSRKVADLVSDKVDLVEFGLLCPDFFICYSSSPRHIEYAALPSVLSSIQSCHQY